MCYFTGGFLAAVLVVVQLPALPDWHWLATALPLAVYVVTGGRVSLTVAGFTLGTLYCLTLATNRVDARVGADYHGRDIPLSGEVTSLPEKSPDVTTFYLLADDLVAGRSVRLRLSWYHAENEVRPGDRLALKVRLNPSRATFNRGLFDYEGWQLLKGIEATGYVRAGRIVDRNPLRNPANSARAAVRDWIESRIDDLTLRQLINALAIGESNQISGQAWRDLSRTGTNHLLIISGLHVGLTAFLVFRLLSVLGVPTGARCIVTILAVALYSVIAGMGLPVQRALVMTSVALVAVCVGRRMPLPIGFCLALLLVVLIEPFAVQTPGFWLSFLAVGALLLGLSGEDWRGLSRFHQVKSSVKAQVLVTLVTTPVLIQLLHQASMTSMVANLVAIPWVSFTVVPPLLLAMVVLPISEPAANGLLQVAVTSLGGLWVVIESISAKSPVLTGPISVLTIGFTLLAVSLAFMPGLPFRRWLAVVLLLPLLKSEPRSIEGLTIDFIDVGQGLSVLMTTTSGAVLYDAGAKYGDRFDVGAQIVTPFLRARGISKLDHFLISHPDNDHAGGKGAINANFQVLNTHTSAHCDSRWQIDDIRFVAFQVDGHSRSRNDASCLLLAGTEAGWLLLTGDVESGAEADLLKRDLRNLRVMSVPHHGSQTSSSPALLNQLMPSVAVLSVGHHNRFDHPSKRVVARYLNRGIRWRSTALHGRVQVRLHNGRIYGVDHDRRQPAFWHTPRLPGDEDGLPQ